MYVLGIVGAPAPPIIDVRSKGVEGALLLLPPPPAPASDDGTCRTGGGAAKEAAVGGHEVWASGRGVRAVARGLRGDSSGRALGRALPLDEAVGL